MERAHGELRARFADGLSGDDTDRRADLDRLVVAEVAAVALHANALARLARHDGAHGDGFDLGVVDGVDNIGVDLLIALRDDRAAGRDVLGHRAAEDADVELLADLVGVGAGDDVGLLRAAVLFADDGVLHGVDEAAREVAGFGGLEGGVGLTLASTVRGDEELEHREALLEVGLDRELDGAAGRVGNETLHGAELGDLTPVTAGAGVDDVRDVVLRDLEEFLHHELGYFRLRLGPHADGVRVTLVGGDEALPEEVVDLLHAFVGFVDEHVVLLRHDDVGRGDRHARERGVLETDVLDAVGEVHGFVFGMQFETLGQDLGELFLRHRLRDVTEAGRHDLFEAEAPHGRVDDLGAFAILLRHADLHLRLEVDHLVVMREEGFVGRAEHHALALLAVVHLREEVATEHHVLDRVDDRLAGGGLEHIAVGRHERASFVLSLLGERHVDGHLVTVEVGVEGRTRERMELDGETFDEGRHERLDTEAVERRGAVEEDVLVLDHLFEDVPHFFGTVLDEALRGLHVVREFAADDRADDERLEELHRHFLREAALIELEVRTGHDDGASGVVDALTEEVLAEAALLALQHVGERAELAAVAGGEERLAAAGGVVEERVDGFLQHAFFVAVNDFRRADAHELLEARVAVDDAAVQVVEVGRGEAAAVELHHRAQVRREHREARRDHPRGIDAGLRERVHELEALHDFLELLARGLLALRLEIDRNLFEVCGGDHFFERFGSRTGAEHVAELHVHLAELQLGEHGSGVQVLEVVERFLVVALERIELLGVVLVEGVELGARGVALFELRFGFLILTEHRLAAVFHGGHEFLLRLFLHLFVHRDHDVRGEVDDLFERLDGQIEEEADAGRRGTEEPDVRDRHGQVDVAHALAADDAARDFHAALLAHDTLIADAFVLAAETLEVLGGSENALAEEAVRFGALGAVVHGFGLGHFAAAPSEDVVGAGDRQRDRVEGVGC